MLTYGAGGAGAGRSIVGCLARLATNLFSTGFAEQMFMPHGMCYLWVPQLYFMHVSSDLLIGLSYVAISSTLIYLIYRARHDIPFSWIFLAFGVLLPTSWKCGRSWHATYWLSGYVKLLTAAASVATAVVLPFRDQAKVTRPRKRSPNENPDMETGTRLAKRIR
jgi:hypothetical protein